MNPKSADARAALSVALDWSGQIEPAVQAGLEAVELDPRSPAAIVALAEAYSDQYRLREADELLVQALDLAPDDPEVHRVIGVLKETRADYAGAVESYGRAIEIAPRWSYLYVSLGHALRAQSQYDEALAAFGKAAELNPMDARAEGGRGMVYYAREEFDHAAARFQRAIELDPTYATAYAQLAWIHYGRREYDRAEPLFAKAIDLDRDGSRVAQYRHALGWIYIAARRPAEARDQFTRALALEPRTAGCEGRTRAAPAGTAARPHDASAGRRDPTRRAGPPGSAARRRDLIALEDARLRRQRVGVRGIHDPELGSGSDPERDPLAVPHHGDEPGGRGDFDHVQRHTRLQARALVEVHQLQVVLGLFHDPLDDDLLAGPDLGERERERRRPRTRARDRIPVRAGHRVAQHRHQPLFDLRRDDVLDQVGLFVGLAPAEAEDLGQQPLGERVAPDDALGLLAARHRSGGRPCDRPS